MTDIRAAAQREVERIMPFDGGGMAALRAEWRNAFPLGAVWAAKRVTPTREQVANELGRHWYDANTEMCDCGWLQFTAKDTSYDNHLADKVLALLAGLAEGDMINRR